MARILITAFEPYDHWSENVSWLTLIEFTKDVDPRYSVTTRLYPVNLARTRQKLEGDLAANYDYAIHLGQAPGATDIHLEAIGLNVAPDGGDSSLFLRPLVADAPLAYRTSLPLDSLCQTLRDASIPARISYHAGTFLCNATLFLSHYLLEKRRATTRPTFIHLPLDPRQVAHGNEAIPSLPAAISAQALRLIVGDLVRQPRPVDQELA